MSEAIVRAIAENNRYYQKVVAGEIEGATIVHKFGRNTAVGTSYVPVSVGGVYPTPQVANATLIHIKAGDAKDTAAGSGARLVTVVGVDASGVSATEDLPTAGASDGANGSNTFLRVFRAYVAESGSYASSTQGSHEQPIVVESSALGDMIVIDGSASSFPRSQSECGVYTIPAGHTGYILSGEVFSDSSKVTNILFFRRTGILQTAPPYDAMRVLIEERLEGGESTLPIVGPIGPIQGPADIGWMARVDTGTAEVDVDFEILVVAD